jgi:amidohydrolase
MNEKRAELSEVSRYIFDHPEVGFHEKESSLKLVEVLGKNGFNVIHPVAGVQTAFEATISSGAERPHIAILAEYDALPELGHACGHNLIATAAVGAGLVLRQILPSLKGRISVIGTPAEEVLSNSGKIQLLRAGLFNDVDVAMIVHPHGNTWLDKPFLAVDEVFVRFSGKSSHAASSPHLGINAHDAAQLTFIGISFLRQQLRQDARIHWGDLKVSGAKNVIPDSSSATICVRGLTDEYTRELREKIIHCIQGAALMTGCRAEYESLEGFRAMKYNRSLNTLFGENLSRLGMFLDKLPEYGLSGSTDMGNVSKAVPSLHPFFRIKDGVAPHTVEFREAAITEAAFEATLIAARAMAKTASDLLFSPELLTHVREDFEGSG